ncbi:MAG: sialate O-acetylesterase [Clostridia bacterium]|nr:sialate O-acetylesterase [Clostridia bacterium]
MIHSFLLIGQSNMAGRGFAAEAAPVDFSRIKILRNGRWQPTFRPINPDRITAGVNLAESFAEAYVRQYDTEVGIIPAADGGTRLEQWVPGSLLFDHAVYQARLAMRTSTIAGILWHQGEGDCSPERYPTYAQRMLPMIEAFRRELDLYDVPFLIGGLGDFLERCELSPYLVNYPHVNAALQQVAQEVDRVGYVPADGLGANPDNLHFSAEGLHAFGLRYFEVFEKLRDPNKVFAEKPTMDDAIRSEMEAL